MSKEQIVQMTRKKLGDGVSHLRLGVVPKPDFIKDNKEVEQQLYQEAIQKARETFYRRSKFKIVDTLDDEKFGNIEIEATHAHGQYEQIKDVAIAVLDEKGYAAYAKEQGLEEAPFALKLVSSTFTNELLPGVELPTKEE